MFGLPGDSSPRINDSLSSTDDPVAATPLFIYLNKGDGYDWPSPPNELAFISPGCVQFVPQCSLWNSHIFLTFWIEKGKQKKTTFNVFSNYWQWSSVKVGQLFSL